MPKETLHISCPFCGMHAPVERITKEGPFALGLFKKTIGGKRKLTPEEREARKGHFFLRGSAPPILIYDPLPITDEVSEAAERRKGEL